MIANMAWYSHFRRVNIPRLGDLVVPRDLIATIRQIRMKVVHQLHQDQEPDKDREAATKARLESCCAAVSKAYRHNE